MFILGSNNVGADSSEELSCCPNYGQYRCTSPANIVEYTFNCPECGPNRPEALDACEDTCNVACIDDGIQGSCCAEAR